MELAFFESRLEDAIDIAFGPAVVQVPLHAVTQKTAPTCNYRIACIILNIKNLKANSRKPIVRYGTKTQLVMYHRLFLCRDLSSGETFYILSEDERQTTVLLSLDRDVPYIGSYVAIYQPRSDGGRMYGAPIVLVSVPLIPAKLQLEIAVVTPVKRDFYREGEVESFAIEITDLVINEATVVPCCSSVVCDGRHKASIMCPGLGSSSSTTGRTFSTRMSSAAHQLDEVVFRSTRLAGYFMAPALLRTDNIKYTSLQGCVMAAMVAYAAANVTWFCQGFYKLQEIQDAEGGSWTKLRIYISRLEPRGAVPDNIILYDGVEIATASVHVPMLPAARQPPAKQQDAVLQRTQERLLLQKRLNMQRLRRNKQKKALLKSQKKFRLEEAKLIKN